MPGTLKATRDGAQWTVETLQTLPDETLKSFAATAVGFGAGLSLTRARRFSVLVGMVPAMVVGVAIAARPAKPVARTATPTRAGK